MTPEAKRNLKNIIHPYLFILKEGNAIKKDFLDYSLMMLLMNSTEAIRSPKEKSRKRKILTSMQISSPSLTAMLGNPTPHE